MNHLEVAVADFIQSKVCKLVHEKSLILPNFLRDSHYL